MEIARKKKATIQYQKIKNELQITPEIQKIIDFVESSERGIIK